MVVGGAQQREVLRIGPIRFSFIRISYAISRKARRTPHRDRFQMTKMERADQVTRLLDKIVALPLGHPDRFRFLTYAEQLFEEPAVDCGARDPGNLAQATESASVLGALNDAAIAA